MEPNGRPRRRPQALSAPSSLHEITRRYYATAIALAKAMGLPCTETFMREHRESISCCYIEAGRVGIRLPPAVQLPPLVGDVPITLHNGQMDPPDRVIVEASVASPNGVPVATDTTTLPPGEGAAAVPSTNGQAPPPITIPVDAGLPCGGQVISDLKPASLSMLLGKVGQLMHTQDREQWVSLLAALQSERARRLARGVRRNGEGPQA